MEKSRSFVMEKHERSGKVMEFRLYQSGRTMELASGFKLEFGKRLQFRPVILQEYGDIL